MYRVSYVVRVLTKRGIIHTAYRCLSSIRSHRITTHCGRLVQSHCDSKSYVVETYLKSYSPTSETSLYASFRFFLNSCLSKFRYTWGITGKMQSEDLAPPASVRGMTSLDKLAFTRDIQVLGIRIPAHETGKITKKLRSIPLHIPRIKSVADLESPEDGKGKYKLLLCDPEKFNSVDSFTEEQKTILQTYGADLKNISFLDLKLTYNNWTYHEILKAILPEDCEGVGGFSTIGHIIHLNLREELLPFKDIIGAVLLDKVACAKTVVNKTTNIDNTYRNFSMEILAGENNLVTTTKEHGASYKMDFSKVYWNPRLATEHQRVVSQLEIGDVIYDVFAGIGPFAVPAAKRKCVVLANDLNPESFRWLEHNLKVNKIKVDTLTYNMDGRDFIRNTVKSHMLQRWREDDTNHKIHIIMNLPAMAIEFLDCFEGLYNEADLEDMSDVVLPLVHCYCFSKELDSERDISNRVKQSLGKPLPDQHTIRLVRNVAPGKDMFCVEFTLERDILIADHRSQSDVEEPPEKKLKDC